jgi:MFS family permease
MTSSNVRFPATAFYYGWLVLAAAAVSEMLAQGATSYAAGLFVLPLQAEFHISRVAANSPVLILFLGGALSAPLVGKAIDRFPIRLVVPLGVLIFSLAMIAIAVSHSLLLMVALLFLPAAIGFVAIGPLTTAAMAARWFHRRRGLALGLAAVATSGGGFTVVPLLSRAIQDHGWRMGLTYEAVGMAVIIIVLALAILRDNPNSVGLGDHPENRVHPAPDDLDIEGTIERAFHWTNILSTRAFWIPSLVLALTSGTAQALVVTLVPYGIGMGMTAGSAAFLISIFAIAAATTKITAGLLADRISKRLLLIAAAFIMMLAWLFLGLWPHQEALFASSALGGIGLGCALPTVAALIAGHFGPARFGAVMGWTYTLIGLIAIGSTLAIGAVYDRSHSYETGFIGFFAILAILFLVTLFLAPPDQMRKSRVTA